eukprot:1753012-Rhodomonas_salina.1
MRNVKKSSTTLWPALLLSLLSSLSLLLPASLLRFLTLFLPPHRCFSFPLSSLSRPSPSHAHFCFLAGIGSLHMPLVRVFLFAIGDACHPTAFLSLVPCQTPSMHFKPLSPVPPSQHAMSEQDPSGTHGLSKLQVLSARVRQTSPRSLLHAHTSHRVKSVWRGRHPSLLHPEIKYKKPQFWYNLYYDCANWTETAVSCIGFRSVADGAN